MCVAIREGKALPSWYTSLLVCFSLLFAEHQFCGGKMEKPQDTLKTPNWPESDYPPGVSCSWHIVAPKGKVTLQGWQAAEPR